MCSWLRPPLPEFKYDFRKSVKENPKDEFSHGQLRFLIFDNSPKHFYTILHKIFGKIAIIIVKLLDSERTHQKTSLYKKSPFKLFSLKIVKFNCKIFETIRYLSTNYYSHNRKINGKQCNYTRKSINSKEINVEIQKLSNDILWRGN